jgi:hypothetical protein
LLPSKESNFLKVFKLWFDATTKQGYRIIVNEGVYEAFNVNLDERGEFLND